MEVSQLQRICRQSLECCELGTESEQLQNGKDFYKFFFANYPQLRVYFKGAENYTPDDVQKSERFEKQGQRLLLAMHLLTDTVADPVTFNAYVRETINRHRQFKIDPALWAAFFTVFIGYLESKKSVSDEERAAWTAIGAIFNEEALKHLKSLGQ